MRRIGIFTMVVAMSVGALGSSFGSSTSEAPVVVANDPTGDAIDPDLSPVASALGLDVTRLALHTEGGALEFIVTVAEMNAPPPNEVIRYLWQFLADGKEYWVQAKMSDVASGTTFVDDPAGAVTHLQGAFRLRGNCQIIGVVSTCVHLAWLDGEFDVANKQIKMRVPLGSTAAPEIKAGGEISPDAEPMTASIQVGISNNSTSDLVPVEKSYTIPG